MIALKLNKREKYGVIAAIFFILGFIVLKLVIFPFMEKKDLLKRSISSQSKALDEMVTLRSEYEAISREARLTKQRLKKRKKDFSLFSFLDSLAGKTGLKEEIVYMKPSTSAPKNSQYSFSLVEMKLAGITINELVSYLHGVENSGKMLTIKRISISKSDKKKELINSILQVETINL